VVQSLLGTYGIPSTLTYDVPNLVYPNNVGEIRVAVPEGLENEALGILAAHRERTDPQKDAALGDAPAAFPLPAPPLAVHRLGDEAEEDDDDDEDEWDDDDDEDDDGDDEGEGLEVDDEDVGDEDDDEDDDDDDLFDDEE
jgi:hypothetical protein